MPNKVVKDCIYGHIDIPELCVQFMDVPEFQRLRRIKQLGMVHYTYPSAVHTRFEHSLGVMFLAGKMADQLGCIAERTKHLIQLGGLYHDIGHSAYSHLFDSTLASNREPCVDYFNMKHHEERSVHLLQKVNARLQLLSRREEGFVVNVITGQMPHSGIAPTNSAKCYLYEIVCNKECGIDVDKMDYLRRDAYHTGFPAFQSDYILLNARIGDDTHICFREKTRHDISDLFATRNKMHVNVYQHHTSREMDKLYFCMMKRLRSRLFAYGERTDDANLETLIRNTEELSELVACVDQRNFSHNCEICREFSVAPIIPLSGNIESVRFIK